MANTGIEIFRKGLFSNDELISLHSDFNNGRPYKHVIIDNFLDPAFAKGISSHFPYLDAMKTRYNGLNEKKSESSDFTHLHENFDLLHAALSTPEFSGWISSWTKIANLHTISDRLGYGLHQGGNNSFLDIHIDYNIHPLKNLLRKLNLIIFFNETWLSHWGGNLEMWDDKVQKCIQSIQPSFNRCVIFECSEISYHGYNRISVPKDVTRKSYYQYYFTPVTSPINFHDTVFKTRPDESLFKKNATEFKEFAKNTLKRVFLKAGWKKFFR